MNACLQKSLFFLNIFNELVAITSREALCILAEAVKDNSIFIACSNKINADYSQIPVMTKTLEKFEATSMVTVS
jgi:hypothetical protein